MFLIRRIIADRRLVSQGFMHTIQSLEPRDSLDRRRLPATCNDATFDIVDTLASRFRRS
jgi:hypothetical protein